MTFFGSHLAHVKCFDHLSVLCVLVSVPHGINSEQFLTSIQSPDHNKTLFTAIGYFVGLLKDLGFGRGRQ